MVRLALLKKHMANEVKMEDIYCLEHTSISALSSVRSLPTMLNSF